MATRTLLHVSRATVQQPLRHMSLLHNSLGGSIHGLRLLQYSSGGSTRSVIELAFCRNVCLRPHLSQKVAVEKSAPSSGHTKVPPATPCSPEGATSSENMDDTIQKNLEDMKSGQFKRMDDPKDLKHFRKPPPSPAAMEVSDPTMVPRDQDSLDPNFGKYTLPHPIWSESEVQEVQITHREPHGIVDNMALYTVKLLRGSYDLISGYNRRPRNQSLWLNRIIFLETVAGVPGMVAAMLRHLNSLRKLNRDHGWIHTLLEEAENERMHLMTAMQLKQPSIIFRVLVMGAQGMFVSMFSLAYMISPRYCHRFVGYLEEEAVITYTKCLKDIDHGLMKHWNTQPAPSLATMYWNLEPAATMRDVILAIRADEAHHRVVNHTFASMDSEDNNPYKPGQ